MVDNDQTQSKEQPRLKFVKPYSTFDPHGNPVPVPYIIDGLFTKGGFSLLAAKPKTGKSSFSRYAAVCVTKGEPFLGRETERGEVILMSLEDPPLHVDNCLKALRWNPESDSAIQPVYELPKTLDDIIIALESALAVMPGVRLVVIDTLPKLLRVSDLSDYMLVMTAIERLRNVARGNPHLHIMAVTHAKKVQTDDPFDQLLGSTALRGETDTTISLSVQRGQRVIESETRIGRRIPASIIHAELAEIAGADVVTSFELCGSMEDWAAKQSEKVEEKKAVLFESRIIDALQATASSSMTQQELLKAVMGKSQRTLEAIQNLASLGVLKESGVRNSRSEPLTWTLDPAKLKLYSLFQSGATGG